MSGNLLRGVSDAEANQILRDIRTKKSAFWEKRGREYLLSLFHATARRVPAYKHFLKKNKISASTILSYDDFRRKVPLTDKDHYLRQYPLQKLCWDGILQQKHWDVSSTSGSTGEPFYFLRNDVQNWQYATTAERYLVNNFNIHRHTTLYINCFALGVWIGGVFTYEALKLLTRRRRYAITLINPGLNKIEILKIMKNFGGYYSQIIIGGYPPFVKDVIDDGLQYGIHWKSYNIKIIFSAEGFSEDFRTYIARKIGLKNIYKDTLNHYGTVDQGTIAHETPLSIFIRRFALQKPELYQLIFPRYKHRLPTLCQYDPTMFFFEEIDNGVVCSSMSGFPLVRYDLKDTGGIFTFDKMSDFFKEAGFDMVREARKAGADDAIWRMPFVYVYERKDMSVSLRGANIYPETIKRALCDKFLTKYITGKFSMMIEGDKRQNPRLLINLELRNGIKNILQVMKKRTVKVILNGLLKESSEFSSVYHEQREKKELPRIRFWPYEHPRYFKVGGKQRWSINQ